MQTEITRIDEEKFLKLKIAENSLFEDSVTCADIIEAIESGVLPLEVSEDDGTKIIDDSSLGEIGRVLPYIRKIVEKPRSFINSIEEKVPVETAKRINHKAMMKLSRDSNDWYARTVLAVKPKNIVSDISEETIDLYENRFICSLVDRIGKLLAQARHYYLDQIKALDDYRAVVAINREYNYSTAAFPFFNKITKRRQYIDQDAEYLKKLEDELDTINKLLKHVRLIKRSNFYRTLHKKRRVADPIQKTNILMFEFNYNQAYKLWIYLNQIHQEEKLNLDVDTAEDDIERYYYLYSFLCIIAAFNDMGFIEDSAAWITWKNNNVYTSSDLIFTRFSGNVKQCFAMETDTKCIRIKYKYYTKQEKWDEFEIYPNYADFEGKTRSQTEQFTAKLLDILSKVDKKKNSNISSRYSFVSLNMTRCSEGNTYSPKVYRRFYGIGNNFSAFESSENLEKWADYKAGISIIAPTDLRYNFLRIEKILNYHILKWEKISCEITNCPLCGGSNVRPSGKDGFICYDCALLFSLTYCNSCDKNHKRPITWVKYLNDKFLQNEEIVRGLNEMTPYHKMSKIETIMGAKATTSFELERETSGWKLKTNCPYCGIQLGDENKKKEKL